MDYKQLSLVCELMGLNLSYSRQDEIHSILIKIKKEPDHSFISTSENVAIEMAVRFLVKNYPIQYANALNQLKLK